MWVPWCGYGGEVAPRSPPFLACPTAKGLVALPPTMVTQPHHQQETPDFPLLLRDVTQLWMDEGPRHCTHKATLQGHGATHPQVSLCGHRVSLGPPHMYPMCPMPW